MSVCRQIDVPLLFRLWADESLRREEIAHRLGCSHAHLAKAVKTYGLPPRVRRPPPVVPVDPTPDEIAERARECRERHLEQRRKEPAGNTFSKVSKWRNGICQPR